MIIKKLYLIIFIFLYLTSLCFAVDQNISVNEKEKKIDEIMLKVINFAVNGDFENAYKECIKASEIEKTELIEKLSRLLRDILNGKIEKNGGVHLFKGLQLDRNGKSDEAITEFELATKALPNYELAYFIFGYACYHSYCATQRGINYIVSLLNKAIELDPNFAMAHYWLAFSHIFSKSPDLINKCKLGIEHYNKAIQLNPYLKNQPCDPAGPCADDLMSACEEFIRGEIPKE